MGAYCSIHNDTSADTVMVYIGANPKIIHPLLWTISGLATVFSSAATWGIVSMTVSEILVAEQTLVVTVSTLASAAGGLVTASNWVLETLQSKLVADFSRGGYHKLLPGQTYTTHSKLPGLNMRAWVVRIQQTPEAIVLQKSNASVWTSTTKGGTNVYRVTDEKYFKKWRKERIPVRAEVASRMDGDGYDVLGATGADCAIREEQDEGGDSWVHVEFPHCREEEFTPLDSPT